MIVWNKLVCLHLELMTYISMCDTSKAEICHRMTFPFCVNVVLTSQNFRSLVRSRGTEEYSTCWREKSGQRMKKGICMVKLLIFPPTLNIKFTERNPHAFIFTLTCIISKRWGSMGLKNYSLVHYSIAHVCCLEEITVSCHNWYKLSQLNHGSINFYYFLLFTFI